MTMEMAVVAEDEEELATHAIAMATEAVNWVEIIDQAVA